MKINFFCPRWGSESLSWDHFCKKVKDAGYDGTEAGVPFDEKERDEMRNALAKHNLLLIGQYWHSFEKDFELHQLAFEKHLYHLAAMKPVKIDSQTGKDYFSFEQNAALFKTADGFTVETGIPVAHETHRNKALFAAHVTQHFLEKIPSLQITADFSHWCNVSESFLEDQEEMVNKAIEHAIHVHARVGHPEGPQVTDPRLPEWQTALHYHTIWWKNIVNHHLQSKSEILTITTEFGPAPYMPAAPLTLQPLADQWDVNVWMMEYLKKELIV